MLISQDSRLRSLADAERVIRMAQAMGTTTSQNLENLMDELPAFFRRKAHRAKNLSFLRKDVIIVASVLVAMAAAGRYLENAKQIDKLKQKITDANKVSDEHRKEADAINQRADEPKKQADENKRLH